MRQLWQRRGVRLGAAVVALVLGVTVLGLLSPAKPAVGVAVNATAMRSVAGKALGAPAVRAPMVGAPLVGAPLVGAPPVGAPVPLPAQAAPPAGVSAGSAGVAGAVGAPAPPTAQQRVVKTATVTLQVGKAKVSSTIGTVSQLAGTAGGYVENSQSQEDGGAPSGTVTMRLPVSRFDEVLARVRALGTVRSAQVSGTDVTGEFVDVAAQLTSLRASRDRYLTILSQAKSVADVLSIQQQVDEVAQQIDRLEAQRKLLAQQSDLATLTVTVGTGADPLVGPAPQPGPLSQAVTDAAKGFEDGLAALIRLSGPVLLLLLLSLVGWGMVLAGRGALRRRHAA